MSEADEIASGGTESLKASKLHWLILAPIALVVLFALTGPIASGDLWWHLSTGEWLLENGELPEHDPFSHTVGEKEWTLEEYGSQILFALAHRAGGLEGLRVLGGVLGLLVLIVSYRTARRRLPPAWATLLTALFAVLFALKWELRPHLLSVFFFFRLQQLLFPTERERAPALREWIEVFLLTVVWVQLHGEAIFVPALAIAGLIGAILEAVRARDGFGRIRSWLVVFVLAALGSLCSPEGLDQVLYALSDSSIPRELIGEWRPLWVFPNDPRFAHVTTGIFLVIAACAVLSAFFVLSQAGRKLLGRRSLLSWERIGFLLSCVILAFIARRFFWLLFFPMLEFLTPSILSIPALSRARSLPATLSLLLLIPLAQSHYVLVGQNALATESWRENTNAALLPENATRFVRDTGLAGNLFHRYEWGGFLGFHLWPTCRVYLDGRTVLFSDVIPERWKIDNWKTRSTLPDEESAESFARRTLAERDARILVMPSLVDLGNRAAKWEPPGAHSEWIRVWEDDTAIVWVSATDTENLERVTEWYAGHSIAFDSNVGFIEAQVVAFRPHWIQSRGLLAPPVKELVERFLLSEKKPSNPRDGSAFLFPWANPERVETWLSLRMGRSARWELKRYLAVQPSINPKQYSAWVALIDEVGPAEAYRRFVQGEQP